MLSVTGNDEFVLADVEEEHDFDLIGQLKQAIINEKSSPELLVFEGELVTSLQELMENQETQVESNSSTNLDNLFVAQLYYIEIDRIKNILKNYLRIRLLKVCLFFHRCDVYVAGQLTINTFSFDSFMHRLRNFLFIL